jgi:hypothetical protein
VEGRDELGMGFAARGAACGGDGGDSELRRGARRDADGQVPRRNLCNDGRQRRRVSLADNHRPRYSGRVLHRQRCRAVLDVGRFGPGGLLQWQHWRKPLLYVRRPIHRHMEHGLLAVCHFLSTKRSGRNDNWTVAGGHRRKQSARHVRRARFFPTVRNCRRAGATDLVDSGAQLCGASLPALASDRRGVQVRRI